MTFLCSSFSSDGGYCTRPTRAQAGHTPHASTPRRERQFSARASSSAKSFLPSPSSPAKSSADGTRPCPSILRKVSFARSFPTSVSNIRRVWSLESGVWSRSQDLV